MSPEALLETTDFAIQIDFQPHSEAPTRVFEAMTSLIKACQEIDEDLARSLGVKIEPILMLEDIQAGSLTALLRSALELVDDDALKSLDPKKLIGSYLVKGKHRAVDFLRDRETIENAQQIYDLQKGLDQAADEAGLTVLSLRTPVPARKIAEDVRMLSEATNSLRSGDGAKFISREGELPINTGFRVTEQRIEEILTQETITNELDMILKVKKPDLLGDSMWEFRHEKQKIEAKMFDTDWVGRFQQGEIPFCSGDALRARVQIETKYGFDREVLAKHHRVLKVYELIPRKQ